MNDHKFHKLTFAAAAVLFAAALFISIPVPAYASMGTGSVEASSHVDSGAPAKEQMLEALNLFRDHGLSVIDIADRIFGTDVLEKSEGTAGDAITGVLESAARKAGSDAAEKVTQAGEEVTQSVQETAKKTAAGFFDTARQKIGTAFQNAFKKIIP